MPHDDVVSASPGARLRALLERPELVVLPGGGDPLNALMAERAGFECFYLSGSLISAHLLGQPDGGVSQREMIDAVRRVCAAVSVPVVVDMDTGYGDAVTTYQTVREYVRAGAAGAHIEDRAFPPRPGRWASFVSSEEMVARLTAALDARADLDPDFVLISRTDRLMHPSGTIDEAIAYATEYKERSGVNISSVYVNTTWKDVLRTIREVPGPVLPLIAQGGPIRPSLQELQEAGAVGAWYPWLTIAAGTQANWELLREFVKAGTPALDAHFERTANSPYGAMDPAVLTGGRDRADDLYRRYLNVPLGTTSPSLSDP